MGGFYLHAGGRLNLEIPVSASGARRRRVRGRAARQWNSALQNGATLC